MKILLVGGGSGGPVAPLLAVAAQIKLNHPKAEFLVVGTKTGPEALMAKQAGVNFVSIASGKWRRYFSPANFSDSCERILLLLICVSFPVHRTCPTLFLSTVSRVE